MKNLVSLAAVAVLLAFATLPGSSPAYAIDHLVPFSGSASEAVVTGDQIFDHGGVGNYANNADGTLTLTAAGPITLTFSVFSTEGCCDFVTIYKGSTAGGTVLFGPQSGFPAVPFFVHSSSGTVTIQFTSDPSLVFQGFQAEVAVGHSGVPAMREWGLALVSVLLLGLGMIILRRRRQTI